MRDSLTVRTVVYILIPCSTFRETKLSACARTSACPSPTPNSMATRPSVLSSDVWDPWEKERDIGKGKEGEFKIYLAPKGRVHARVV